MLFRRLRGGSCEVGAEIESLQIFIRNLIVGEVKVDWYSQQILGEPQVGGTFGEGGCSPMPASRQPEDNLLQFPCLPGFQCL